MPGITKQHDDFETLVQALSDKLGPSSGINSDDVDEHEIQQLMKDYTSDESDWSKYSFSSTNMPYTRNLVDQGNGKSNLVPILQNYLMAMLTTKLILVWSPGHGSPIHDHANAHCIMKILKGSLTEARYAWPTVNLNQSEERPLQILSETTYNTNEVTYMSDKLGLHRISNPDPKSYAVSLHLYTPPNAAVYGCNTFDESTGQVKHIKKCTTFSEYGVRPGAA